MKLLQSSGQQKVRLENLGLDFNRLLKRFYRVTEVTLAEQVETQKVQELSRSGFSLKGGAIGPDCTGIFSVISIPHSHFGVGIGCGLRLEFGLKGRGGRTYV
jgi:hypothetical protein